MIGENKKYFRLSLAKIEERLKSLLDKNSEIENELADKLTKRVDNKIDLLSKSIGKYVYEIIGHPAELKGSFIDKDLKPVEWILSIYNYGFGYGYIAQLSFQKQDQDFKAWVRSDKTGIQVTYDDEPTLKDIRQYYDHLNIWVDKYIHTDELVSMLTTIHWNKLNREVDMLDDDDLE